MMCDVLFLTDDGGDGFETGGWMLGGHAFQPTRALRAVTPTPHIFSSLPTHSLESILPLPPHTHDWQVGYSLCNPPCLTALRAPSTWLWEAA